MESLPDDDDRNRIPKHKNGPVITVNPRGDEMIIQEIATPDTSEICDGCSWCGGSGWWTDPNGQKWPCIQCNPPK